MVLFALYCNAYFHFWMQYKVFLLGYTIRTQCAGLIYRKLFKLNASGDRSTSAGKILNILNNDLRRIDDTFICSCLAIQFPIFLGGTVYQVYDRLGLYPVLTVVFGILIALGCLYFQATWLGSLREKIAASTDSRCKAMEELISAIKIVKMYCWESAFLEKIIGFRKEEIKRIKKRNYWGHATHRFLTSFGRILTVITLFVAFAFLNIEDYKSGDMFVAQTFISDLNWNFGILFWAVFLVRESKVSLDRVQELLLAEEKDIFESVKTNSDSGRIEINNVTASWPGTSESVLKNIDLKIEPGSLVGVIGQVGAGKSSFLSLLLGELKKESADSSKIVPRNIGYVPQEAWIFGGTIRENILLGKPFNEEKYSEIIRVCSLVTDLKNFKNNDQTFVGEKGLTLSGGQRARINLARALYQNASLYLLDDPLAAVDTKVVNSLYNDAITGYLSTKTRVLVTHHINLLTNADTIICLHDNRIIFNGTFEQMRTSQDPIVLDFMKSGSTKEKSKKVKETKTSVDSSETFLKENQTEFLSKEEKRSGKLGFQYYIDYYLLCGSKYLVLFWIFLLVCTIASSILTELQLVHVGNIGDGLAMNCTELSICEDMVLDNENMLNGMYLYVICISSYVMLQIISVLIYVNITLGTSQNTHDISVASVIKTPMDFFYQNPVGRILNRFTKDIDVLDDELIGQNDE